MSRAFVKESEGEWLGDVAPDIDSLLRYLTKENGFKVVEIVQQIDRRTARAIYSLSDGNSYMLDDDGRWSRISA